MLLTFATVLLSYTIIGREKPAPDFWILAHHMLYQTVLPFNFLTTFVYWFLLHKEYAVEFQGQYLELSQLVIVHSVPLLVCLINTYTTNAMFSRSFQSILDILFVVFSFHNMVVTKMKGEPIYWFLTWETMETPIFLGAVYCSVWLLFKGLCVCDK